MCFQAVNTLQFRSRWEKKGSGTNNQCLYNTKHKINMKIELLHKKAGEEGQKAGGRVRSWNGQMVRGKKKSERHKKSRRGEEQTLSKHNPHCHHLVRWLISSCDAHRQTKTTTVYLIGIGSFSATTQKRSTHFMPQIAKTYFLWALQNMFVRISKSIRSTFKKKLCFTCPYMH